MKRKYDPSTTDVPQVRHLPARRVPSGCNGTATPHYWLVDAIEVALRFPDFFQRHQDGAPDLVWVVCAHCEYPYHTQAGRAPKRGKARFCRGCHTVLPPHSSRGGRSSPRCAECRHAHRRRLASVAQGTYRERRVDRVEASRARWEADNRERRKEINRTAQQKYRARNRETQKGAA